MKVLILDSNSSDAEIIKQLYSVHCTQAHTFDVAESLEEMIALFKNDNYQVLFLNVHNNTPQIFEFLDTIYKNSAHVVLTSFEADEMIQVYNNHNIAGYLSKPYRAEQFIQTINRINKSKGFCDPVVEDQSHFKTLIEQGVIKRIALTTLDGYVIVHYNDIVRCEANGNYTSVYFKDGSFLMLTKTLKHYASILEEQGFFRVHKTHLVNINYIRSYVKGKNSYVELTDGSNIEVSSRKKQVLVEILNN